MKVLFYFDWFPGMDMKYATAYTEPPKKLPGFRRYKFTVGVPDPNDPDMEIEVAPQNIEEVVYEQDRKKKT